ncbi:hypothetical protein, partial [Escherichia coli]|uniref:hypothetical protein n=1 Tax=Escherichia coli TaxID=562 RepID=UPI001BE4784D
MLELALFTSADEAATQRLQPVLHEKVSKEAGCQVHFPLKDAKNEAGFGDLAVWTNPASHRVAGKKLTAD